MLVSVSMYFFRQPKKHFIIIAGMQRVKRWNNRYSEPPVGKKHFECNSISQHFELFFQDKKGAPKEDIRNHTISY